MVILRAKPEGSRGKQLLLLKENYAKIKIKKGGTNL